MKDSIYYYGMGVDLLEKGDTNEALNYFKESLKIDEHFKTYEQMYVCLKKMGNKQEARLCIEKAYNINPHNDKTAVIYATELIDVGENEVALGLINEILQRNPSYGPALKKLDGIKNQEIVNLGNGFITNVSENCKKV